MLLSNIAAWAATEPRPLGSFCCCLSDSFVSTTADLRLFDSSLLKKSYERFLLFAATDGLSAATGANKLSSAGAPPSFFL